jgi:hypothetical protein
MYWKQEELPFIADYARDNFVRDKADFIAYSPEYETDFLAKFDPQLKLVREAEATAKVLAEQKALTKRIETDYKTARNWTNKIEDYASKTPGSLKISIEDFGFKVLRKNINSKNDEGTILKFKAVLQNVDANITALQAKGFTAAQRLSVGAFVDAFEIDIKNQSRKIDEKIDLVKDNNDEYELLWTMVRDDILKTGKVIYKEKDKTKLPDYTFTDLLGKIRLARKEKEAAATSTTTGTAAATTATKS